MPFNSIKYFGKKNILLVLIFLLPALKSDAQQLLIDSLRNAIAMPRITEQETILTMSELAYSMKESDLDKGIAIGEKALGMARRQHDGYYACKVMESLSALYTLKEQHAGKLLTRVADSIGFYANRSLRPEAKALARYVEAKYYWMKNGNENSIALFLPVLEEMINLKMYKYSTKLSYLIAADYNYISDLKSSRKFTLDCKHFAELSKDPNNLCIAYLALGNFYLSSYQIKKDNRQLLDSANMVFKKTMDIFIVNEGYMTDRSVIANAAINLASNYSMYEHDYPKDKIIEYLDIANYWGQKTQNKQVLASYDAIRADMLMKEGKFKEAEPILIEFAMNAISYYDDYYQAATTMHRLSEEAEKLGFKEKALAYYKLYTEYHEVFSDQGKFKTSRELEEKYENREKEKEIAMLKERSQTIARLNIISIILIVASCLLLIVIIWYYKLKIRFNRQQKKELENEATILKMRQEEAVLLAKLKEEEAELLALEQKEMLQKNEQLQKELLVGTVHLNQKDELLKNIKEQLEADESAQSISMTIKKHFLMDKDFESFNSNLQNIHPDFFNRLQEQSVQKLTALEVKYCVFIYMSLSSKQIASTMNVETKTVHQTKYRIKKKLNLAKDSDLDVFIQSII